MVSTMAFRQCKHYTFTACVTELLRFADDVCEIQQINRYVWVRDMTDEIRGAFDGAVGTVNGSGSILEIM